MGTLLIDNKLYFFQGQSLFIQASINLKKPCLFQSRFDVRLKSRTQETQQKKTKLFNVDKNFIDLKK